MKDRFTDATSELVDNNPYVCSSCVATYGHPTLGHIDDMPKPMEHRLETRDAECILNCDPMPFGD